MSVSVWRGLTMRVNEWVLVCVWVWVPSVVGMPGYCYHFWNFGQEKFIQLVCSFGLVIHGPRVSQDQSPGTQAATGDFGFLTQYYSETRRNAELANGRLAMTASTGCLLKLV